jgi:hypothetical protein
MATRAQIERLAQRIDSLAVRLVALEPSPECWIVDGDRAYQPGNPAQVIGVAALETRPTGRTRFPSRIVRLSIRSTARLGRSPMVSRAQLDRLSARIDALAPRQGYRFAVILVHVGETEAPTTGQAGGR